MREFDPYGDYVANREKNDDAKRTYDFARKAHRRDAGFDFMMDRRRANEGIPKGGVLRGQKKTAGEALAERDPQYPKPDSLPEYTNGMGLDSATYDPKSREWSGKYVRYADPTQEEGGFGNKGEGFDPIDAALGVGRGVESLYSGIWKRLSGTGVADKPNDLGRALSASRDRMTAGNPSGSDTRQAPPSQDPYENMSEDELYNRASKGDRRAQEVGKQRFRA